MKTAKRNSTRWNSAEFLWKRSGWAIVGLGLGAGIDNLPPIGELWETFDGLDEGDGDHVLNGPHRLVRLIDVIRAMGTDLLGTRLSHFVDQPFPILIKYLSPSQALSVQVHPDDEYTHHVENANGKTEMWIVLDTTPIHSSSWAGSPVGPSKDLPGPSRQDAARTC